MNPDSEVFKGRIYIYIFLFKTPEITEKARLNKVNICTLYIFLRESNFFNDIRAIKKKAKINK